MPSIRAGVRRRRSTTVAEAPAEVARSTSSSVGGQHLVGALDQQVGGGQERRVLGRGGRLGQHARGGACPRTQLPEIGRHAVQA